MDGEGDAPAEPWAALTARFGSAGASPSHAIGNLGLSGLGGRRSRGAVGVPDGPLRLGRSLALPCHWQPRQPIFHWQPKTQS